MDDRHQRAFWMRPTFYWAAAGLLLLGDVLALALGWLEGEQLDSFKLKALEANGASPREQRVLLLGAGGAGSAIAFHVAQEAQSLDVLNRSGRKARTLAKSLRGRFHANTTGSVLSPLRIQRKLESADILINATSVGMYPHADQTLVDPRWLRQDLVVMDAVYNPLETQLVKAGKRAGAKVIDGIEMPVSHSFKRLLIPGIAIPCHAGGGNDLVGYASKSRNNNDTCFIL